MKRSERLRLVLGVGVFLLIAVSLLFLKAKILHPFLGVSSNSPTTAEYRYGNRVGGYVLSLRANGTYTEEHFHSTASKAEQDRQEGIYTNKESSILFTPSHPEQKPWTGYLVAWGQRTYLLKEGDFERFCRAIQTGEEPRHVEQSDDFPMSNPQEKAQPTGLPEFPKAFQHLLTEVHPVEPGIEAGYAYLYRKSKAAILLFQQNSVVEATHYALDVLKRSEYLPERDLYTHDMNIVLGAIALQGGKTKRAKEYLAKAAESFPSRSSSPYKMLLAGLWKRGETEPVLEYVDALIKHENDPEHTQGWRDSVTQGKIPALFQQDEE